MNDQRLNLSLLGVVAVVAFIIGHLSASNKRVVTVTPPESALNLRPDRDGTGNPQSRAASRHFQDTTVAPPSVPMPGNTLGGQQPNTNGPQRSYSDQPFFADWVAKTARDRTNEYAKVFSEFAVPAELSEKFQSNLVSLHKKAIDAGEPLKELIASRNAYDKEMQSTLGPENYARYRAYEDAKPAMREYNLLSEFATKEGNISIDPSYQDTIVQLIKNAGATTTETWHEPYDPLPRPTVGQENVINRISEKIARLSEQSQILFDSLSEAQLPQEYNEVIKKYYAKVLSDEQESLAYFSRPVEAFHKDAFLRLQAASQRQ